MLENNFYIRGTIRAISTSLKKGTKKQNVANAVLKKDFGVIGDAHAGAGNRQVSLLAEESIAKMRCKGLNVKAGDFGENITTQGVDLLSLKIGDRLKIGKQAVLEISQIGKDCRRPCSIYYTAGDCIMPKNGVFGKVLKGGKIGPGDAIKNV